MRMMLAAASVLAFAGLAGCATSATHDSYSDQLRQLTEDCTARGGILSPTGQQTGRPQTDNVCRITGGGSRLPPGS